MSKIFTVCKRRSRAIQVREGGVFYFHALIDVASTQVFFDSLSRAIKAAQLRRNLTNALTFLDYEAPIIHFSVISLVGKETTGAVEWRKILSADR
jgi:hypothetical protein